MPTTENTKVVVTEGGVGAFKCANGHLPERGIVCGGDLPFLRRGDHMGCAPNAYFFVDLQTGEFICEPYGFAKELVLDDEDWAAMESHAAGGCVAEPQCPDCLEFLELTRAETGETE
jgi:hypothetical protein